MAIITSERIPNAPATYNQQHMNALSRILKMLSRKLDTDAYRLGTKRTPASASDTGEEGSVIFDDDYVYICVAPDTWKRANLSTF